MSHKKAKHMRKYVKNYLSTTMNTDKPNMSLGQLETFVQLHVFLTGGKPEKITLVPDFYNYYVQEIQHQAEAMGLQQGLKDDKVTFLGIPLEKREPEVTIAKS